MMKLNELDGNKIILTGSPYDFIKNHQDQKETIVITPLMKASDFVNLTTKGMLQQIINYHSEWKDDLINNDKLQLLVDELNNMIGFHLVEREDEEDKIIKSLLKLETTVYLDLDKLYKVLEMLNKNISKQMNILITGFNGFDISKPWEMLNICNIINSVKGSGLTWDTIESLILFDKELFEIEDKEKLRAWLELKCNCVIQISDIEDYFSGRPTMNSFLIEKALNLI